MSIDSKIAMKTNKQTKKQKQLLCGHHEIDLKLQNLNIIEQDDSKNTCI